ncbi:hypothetical protein [Candidatus Finniella inopinata]|uniref:Uncharacterized protein n=1 Tax=Candidatus Finniella inopinata TaxID=1696036 RepID=A0A4Q7DHQ8_9PROT|nr:hypothetical protein [Candidatus Finniella inopinata]RZI45880.1 hypothetical protein EQU50_05470 [Candidatus Finniella inopinata]
MRAADGEMLHRLFYEPKVDAWLALYQKVAPERQFSALDLVTWLDETKTNIFDAYAAPQGPEPIDRAVYLYIPTLFDNAIQKIYTGCLWRKSNLESVDFSDKRDELVKDKIIEVYNSAVSGLYLVKPKGRVFWLEKSSEEKKGKAPNSKKSHFVLSELSHEQIQQKIFAKDPLKDIKYSKKEFGQITSILLFGEMDDDMIYSEDDDDTIYWEEDVPYNDSNGCPKSLYTVSCYGHGLKLLTPAQLRRIMTSLATDQHVSLKIKTNLLYAAFQHPTTTPEAISQALFACVKASIPEPGIIGAFDWLQHFSDQFHSELNVEKFQKLHFSPSRQDQLLKLYEEALKKRSENLLSKWETLFKSPLFSKDKVFSKALAACQILKDIMPKVVQSFLSSHEDKWVQGDEETKKSVEAMLMEISNPYSRIYRYRGM